MSERELIYQMTEFICFKIIELAQQERVHEGPALKQHIGRIQEQCDREIVECFKAWTVPMDKQDLIRNKIMASVVEGGKTIKGILVKS